MKKIFSLFIILTSIIFSDKISAQQLTPPQQQSVNKLFKTSSVVYFKFKVNSLQEIAQFSKLVSVDKTKGAEVTAHATKAQFTQFIRMNYPYTVISGGAPKKKTSKTSVVKKPVKKK